MMTGFGNHFSTEAVPGALPLGQNSPQNAPFGLYAEQLSGTAFTAPRAANRRSWLYRLRPSAEHSAFEPYAASELFRSGPFQETAVSPNRLRWQPLPLPAAAVDFIDGLVTFGGNGSVGANEGIGVHLYRATASMVNRVFVDADGELLIVPQQGSLQLVTEFGRMTLAPGYIGVLPRGIKFCVTLSDGPVRGYVCENYGPPFRLPELGPIGSNGLANSRDFETPHAAFENLDVATELVQKFMGSLWTSRLTHSPFDVVAWHGNYAPYRYDLHRFNVINSVSFDHPDPSIFTLLTAPSAHAGVANCDFVIFPPRWMVAEHTFRPPWFHRNPMSEFMGLIQGQYDAKESGFTPGGASLHNCMSAHGPDRASYEKAVQAELRPTKISDTLAFMFESSRVICPTRYALECPELQSDYDACWSGFSKAQVPA